MESNINSSTGGQKRKQSSPTASSSRLANANDEDERHKAARRMYGAFEENFETYNELESLTHDVASGSHTLTLEHNNATSAKCRAAKCLVREQARETDGRIYAPYRINIEAVNPDSRHWSQIDKPNRRYFHVSCLEAIGVNIAKFARLRSEYAVSHMRMGAICMESQDFHPAIYDWVTQKGKAFDAAKYATFEKPLEDWRESLKGHVMFSPIHDVSGSTLERPKSSDYIEGEPTERMLSDVVLHVMGAEHLANAPAEIKIGVLEVYGGVPPSLTKAALAVEDEGDSVDNGVDSVDSAEASAQVDEAEPIPQAEDVRQADKDKGGKGEEEPKRATE